MPFRLKGFEQIDQAWVSHALEHCYFLLDFFLLVVLCQTFNGYGFARQLVNS